MHPSVRQVVVLGGNKPQLNLDFASGTLDSRITFTRASTATYVNSSGVIVSQSSGNPRFGYDPVTLAPLGLLTEEARTNLLFPSGNSGSFAGWGAFGTSKVAAGATGIADPFGTNNAMTLVSDGTSGQHFYGLGPNFPAISGNVYACSIFVKAGTANLIQISPNGAAFAAGQYANFSLTGTGSVTQSSGVTASIQAFPGGWYRLSIVATATVTTSAAAAFFACFITSGTDTAGPTNSSAGTVVVIGGQVEIASVNYPGPTSHIPTTSGTVTRAADVASMTSTNFSSWYNQVAGTFVVQATPPGNYDQNAFLLGVGDGTTGNEITLRKSNAAVNAAGKRWTAFLRQSASTLASITTGSDSVGAATKLALAVTANDASFYLDSASVGVDTALAMPTVDRMGIGVRSDLSTWFNGHIGSIKYYNTRLADNLLLAKTQ